MYVSQLPRSRATRAQRDARVVPTANPDQLLLFKSKQLDGAWTVEPWVSLLETEAGAIGAGSTRDRPRSLTWGREML